MNVSDAIPPPKSIKIFQDLCLIAYLWNIISLIALIAHEEAPKWAAIFNQAGTSALISHVLIFFVVIGIFLVFLAPLMGMPYWLSLLIVRGKSKAGKVLLYIFEIGLALFFIGWLGLLSKPGVDLNQKIIGGAFTVEGFIIAAALIFLWRPHSRNWLKGINPAVEPAPATRP